MSSGPGASDNIISLGPNLIASTSAPTTPHDNNTLLDPNQVPTIRAKSLSPARESTSAKAVIKRTLERDNIHANRKMADETQPEQTSDPRRIESRAEKRLRPGNSTNKEPKESSDEGLSRDRVSDNNEPIDYASDESQGPARPGKGKRKARIREFLDDEAEEEPSLGQKLPNPTMSVTDLKRPEFVSTDPIAELFPAAGQTSDSETPEQTKSKPQKGKKNVISLTSDDDTRSKQITRPSASSASTSRANPARVLPIDDFFKGMQASLIDSVQYGSRVGADAFTYLLRLIGKKTGIYTIPSGPDVRNMVRILCNAPLAYPLHPNHNGTFVLTAWVELVIDQNLKQNRSQVDALLKLPRTRYFSVRDNRLSGRNHEFQVYKVVPREGKSARLDIKNHVSTPILCQTRGRVAKTPCNSCAKGLGAFTECVLLDGYMAGHCASCAYNGEGTRCTYPESGQSKPRTPTKKRRAELEELGSDEQEEEPPVAKATRRGKRSRVATQPSPAASSSVTRGRAPVTQSGQSAALPPAFSSLAHPNISSGSSSTFQTAPSTSGNVFAAPMQTQTPYQVTATNRDWLGRIGNHFTSNNPNGRAESARFGAWLMALGASIYHGATQSDPFAVSQSVDLTDLD